MFKTRVRRYRVTGQKIKHSLSHVSDHIAPNTTRLGMRLKKAKSSSEKKRSQLGVKPQNTDGVQQFESAEGIENHLRTEIRFLHQQTETIHIHCKLHKAAPRQHGS